MSDGWTESSAAWIASQGDGGDFGRRFVLDAPMLARVRVGGFTRALDVGCGEGRFCRMLRAEGVDAVGVDPTEPLIDCARERDPAGDYRLGRAEALDFPDAAFDLVVSYLSLIDVADFRTGLAEMVRVLAPGGALLIANLNSFATASVVDGWVEEPGREPRFCIDHYLREQARWVEWRGIRIRNWHRPLSAYIGALLGHGLTLAYFDEPPATGGGVHRIARYGRVPHFHIMEWRKPVA